MGSFGTLHKSKLLVNIQYLVVSDLSLVSSYRQITVTKKSYSMNVNVKP